MKIPKPTKRGDNWRVFVNFDKKRYSGTFDTEKQAKDWAARKLIELQDAKRYSRPDDLPNKSFREAIDLYVERVSINKKGYRWEVLRYNKIMRDNPEFVNKIISEIKSNDLANYRDKRLKEVTNTTVNRELELLSAVFTYAVKELGWCNVNPVSNISRAKEPPPRHRRPSDDELRQILERCNYSGDGETLASTNYWQSESAKKGECYLTWNKGTGRLLVPNKFKDFIDEIKRTKIVEIEYIKDGLQLFFIDQNPDFPYMLQLAKEQTDRYDTTKGTTKIAVYTVNGLQFEFDTEVV